MAIISILKYFSPLLGAAALTIQIPLKEVLLQSGADAAEGLVGPGIAEAEVPNLGGSSIQAVNRACYLIIGGLSLALLTGAAVDTWVMQAKPSKQTSVTAALALAFSYALLVPGLCETLFSFLITIDMLGINVVISTTHDSQPGADTESMISLISRLKDFGAMLGCVLVVLYAIVVPVAKLFMLCLGEYWRVSADRSLASLSRRFIQVVQVISKWACPDMFAYILILTLFREVGKKSDLIKMQAELDVGFTCFSVFCVTSTLASLSISPEDSGDQKQPPPPPFMRLLGLRGMTLLVGLLTLAFAVLMGFGFVTPVMGLRISKDMILQPIGPLPAFLGPVIDGMGLEEQMNTDVTLGSTIRLLASYIRDGEVNCIIAIVMLLLNVVALTVLDMCALLAAMLTLSGSGKPDRTLPAARVLKHCSMLDVFCMGTLIICASGETFQKQGIFFLLMPGWGMLVAAEVLHYITFYLVDSVASYCWAPGGAEALEPEPEGLSAQ